MRFNMLKKDIAFFFKSRKFPIKSCFFSKIKIKFFFLQNMKSFRKELWFTIPARMDFVNITPEVEKCLRESGIKEGLCLVNAMNITASVFINDDGK